MCSVQAWYKHSPHPSSSCLVAQKASGFCKNRVWRERVIIPHHLTKVVGLCVTSCFFGNGSHHITSLPLLISMESVGILYPATEPCHQISPERLLTVGTSRKEDWEWGWLFTVRLIVRLQNSLFVLLNCWGYFCVIEILNDKISRLVVPLHSVSNTR